MSLFAAIVALSSTAGVLGAWGLARAVSGQRSRAAACFVLAASCGVLAGVAEGLAR